VYPFYNLRGKNWLNTDKLKRKSFYSLPDAVNWMFDLQKFRHLSSDSLPLPGFCRPGNLILKSRYIHLAGTNGKGSVAAMLSLS